MGVVPLCLITLDESLRWPHSAEHNPTYPTIPKIPAALCCARCRWEGGGGGAHSSCIGPLSYHKNKASRRLQAAQANGDACVFIAVECGGGCIVRRMGQANK